MLEILIESVNHAISLNLHAFWLGSIFWNFSWRCCASRCSLSKQLGFGEKSPWRHLISWAIDEGGSLWLPLIGSSVVFVILSLSSGLPRRQEFQVDNFYATTLARHDRVLTCQSCWSQYRHLELGMKRIVFLLTKVRRAKWRGSHPPVVVDTRLMMHVMVLHILCPDYRRCKLLHSRTVSRCRHLMGLDVLIPHGDTLVGVVWS